MHRVNELGESLPSSHRGSLVSSDLATIKEKEPMTLADEHEGPTESTPMRANCDLKKNKFFGSNNSIAMMVKGSKRGRSLSMPFIHKGPPDLHRTESEKIFLQNMTMILSGLYCKILIVLGASLPVAEVLWGKTRTENHCDTCPLFPSALYKGFYLYLYIVSMLFLVFVYSTLLKQKAVDTVLSSAASELPGSSDRQRPRVHQHPTGRYGSFYLRMGAVAFGIGSMIYSGLDFGHYLEMAHRHNCRDILMALTPTIRMAFIIIQLQFIFVSDKQKMVKEYKTVSRFGLMHMIATNVCVWLSVVVTETTNSIMSHTNKETLMSVEIGQIPSNSNKSALPRTPHEGGKLACAGEIKDFKRLYGNYCNGIYQPIIEPSYTFKEYFAGIFCAIFSRRTGQRLETDGCNRADIMGNLVRSAAPFLSPCTIEYSLICSVILYALWKNVCTNKTNVVHTGAYANKVPKPVTGMTSQHFTVDCANAHKGLFASIIVLVFTIISLIMFYVLIKEENYAAKAVFQVNVCELTLYVLGALACLLAMYKIKQLRYEKNRQFELDTMLLITAQSGLYMYFMFSLIAGYLTLEDPNPKGSPPTVIVKSICGIVQSTMQTLFIVDAWWRRCTTSQNSKEKPARQLVTFLLLTNVAMWSINHLENARVDFHPIELKFYKIHTWSIITQISMPLAVFYRFHSTVCLCEIWKCTYKTKLQPAP